MLYERKIDLIYCGVGNPSLDNFAISVGFLYGMRLPTSNKIPYDLFFADQDWKNPQLGKYRDSVLANGVKVCTVLDWEFEEQSDEVFSWIEELSPLVGRLIVIPKIRGIIDRIPPKYNGTEIVLGYSVPTGYGKTDVPESDFKNRPTHLLGGSPEKQLELYDKMNVVSADCNYISMKATKYCEFWNDKSVYTRKWKPVKDLLGAKLPDNCYTSFFLSCVNYMAAWNNKLGGIYYGV